MNSTSQDGTIVLSVNGRNESTQSDPGMPLLYLLRNSLGLTACKFGCGEGRCGACTVLVDGRATHSCDTPLWAVQGKSVQTLEALAEPGGKLSAVQRAFVAENAIQCGFCIPGIMMRLVALQQQEPLAEEARIREVLTEHHLCRCGTHVRILAAARRFFDAAKAACTASGAHRG